MLRKIRIILAGVFFIGVTLLFLDFTGTIHAWLGWMAKIQFLPAVLASSTVIVAFLLMMTILFGRVYCSVICPLGIMQDIISWAHGKTAKKNRYRFSYSPARKILRYGMLGIFILALILGAHSFVALIAPYSAYGRIASNLLAPIYQCGNNLLALIAEKVSSYAFYSTEIWIKSGVTFGIAAATLIVVGILAWKHGRTWCNTICPVGTILGFFSKRSIFAPVIDTEKCRNCGLCGRQCKASCINMQEHEIDYSRCVVCMDCIEACNEGAIHYAFRYGKKNSGTGTCQSVESHKQESEPKAHSQERRAFLISSAIIGTSAIAKAQEMKVDGGLAPVSRAEKPMRTTPIVPAGSKSLKNFANHCTGCQLCVSVCPDQVLRPSGALSTLMQPEMSFERGYCRPECTKCSDVCPAGAILPVSVEEKSSIQIGHAVVDLDICVVNTDNVKCGNCAEHCPVGAIRLVKKNPDEEESLKIPVVRTDRCIGCGACENLCPARPLAAIYVEGNVEHIIK